MWFSNSGREISHAGFRAALRHRFATLLVIAIVLDLACHSATRANAADAPRVPNIVFILADDKYGQGIVNREFLSENKVFYHQSVESALAAI